MTDDPVEQALADLQDLVRCRCHPAYTDRGLRDPDCECDSTEAVKAVADRIKELEVELLETQDRANAFATKEYYTEMRAERAEAKLAKAVDALHEAWFMLTVPMLNYEPEPEEPGLRRIKDTLAELTGGKDD